MSGLPSLGADLFSLLELYNRVMLVGPTDVGKSTFARDLVKFWLEKGYRPCAVDLDVGQSDIGPVGTLGAVLVENSNFTLFSELEPVVLEFFGYLAPSFDLISYVWCLKKLASGLKKFDKVVIDTTGWVAGYDAFSLKLVKAEIFGVDVVVLIGEGIFKWERAFSSVGFDVLKVLPSKFVVPKDRKRRRVNRYAATESFFKNKPLVKMRLSEHGLWIRSAKDLKYSLLGGFDREFNTVAVGWIMEHQVDEIVVKLHILKKVKPSLLRIGQKVTL